MKKILLIATMAALTMGAAAQDNGVNSPYSRYGLGSLSNRTMGFNRALAGTGIGMNDGRFLNVQNPASYARIDSLSFLFDIGTTLQNANFSINGTRENHASAQFDHLAGGFRIRHGLGISLGVVPFSKVGYDITTTGNAISNGISGEVVPTTYYKGEGGLHEVFVGLGYAPLQQLAVGVNASYLWGTLSNTAQTAYSESSIQSLYRFYNTEIRSYRLDFGAQFSQRIGRKHELTLGLTYGLGHKLNGNAEFINQRGASTSAAADTLIANNPYELPHAFGVGVAWKWNNSVRVGVDYQLQQWSKVTAPAMSNEADGTSTFAARKNQYTDYNKVSLGAEYLGNPRGNTWSSHVRYRMGLSYATPYAKINGLEGPKSYTASLGVALPLATLHTARDNHSYLNISAEYEHVKPQFAGQITERYFRITLGLSFNQRWFQKWKVD